MFDGRSGINQLAFTNFIETVTLGKLATGQSIAYTGEAGKDTVAFNPNVVTLAGGIDINAGKGVNALLMTGDGTVKVGTIATGQSVKFLDGSGTSEIDLGGKVVTLKGSVEMSGQASSAIFVNGSSVTVGKTAAGDSILFSGGDTLLALSGGIVLLGNLTEVGGSVADELGVGATPLNRLTVKGNVTFDGGAGDDTLALDTPALMIGGKLTFTGGAGTDNAVVAAEGSIGGDVLLDMGVATAADQAVVLKSRQGLRSGLRLNGALTVNSAVASANTDSLVMTNVAVAKAFNITFDVGKGFIQIDNLIANDVLNIATGAGDDQVFLERGDFAGNSIIAKLATIQLGAGADSLLISRATPPPNGGAADSTRVRFLGGLNADGGADGDTRNTDLETENDFPLGPPTLTSF